MTIEFTLPAELEAHDPPEARGMARDGVRMLVSRGTTGQISHHRFTELPGLLVPGDLIVVNTSGTLPAAVTAVAAPAGAPELAVHFSGPRPDGGWLAQPRERRGPAHRAVSGREPRGPQRTAGGRGPHPGRAGHRPPVAHQAVGCRSAVPTAA